MPQDFSNIPPPDSIEEVNYEVHFDRMITQLKMLNARFTSIKESDPVYTAFQVMAYEITSKVQEMNDRVRAVLLLTSSGADLDNLGVIYQEKRRVLSPGNPDVNPPIPATLETDTDYRRRLLSAFKSLALGSSDWYQKLLLESGSPFEQTVKDAQVLGPEDNAGIARVDPTDPSVAEIIPGQVWCYIEAISETTPIPSIELLTQIENYLDRNLWPDGSLPRSQASLRRFIGDRIKVRSCIQKPYTIQATITPLVGLDNSVVQSSIESIGVQFTKDNQRIGQEVPLSSIYSTLDTNDVFRMDLIHPTQNIEPKLNELPIASIAFELEVTNYVSNLITWANFSGQTNSWSIIEYPTSSNNWYIVFTKDVSTTEDLNKLQGVGVGRKFEILDKSTNPPTVKFSGQVISLLGNRDDHYLFQLSEQPNLSGITSGSELFVSFRSAVDITITPNSGG